MRAAKFVVVFFLLASVISYTQTQTGVLKTPDLLQETTSTFILPNGTDQTNYQPEGWYLVDSMCNSLSMAGSSLNPLCYDIYSNTFALVHRSVSSLGGVGALYYNVSDGGEHSWSRVNGPINNGTQSILRARYPNMVFSNATNSTNVADVVAAFTYPTMTNDGSQPNFCGIAADAPAGSGTTIASLLDDEGRFGFSNILWAATKNERVYWIANYVEPPPAYPNAFAKFFYTSDFSDVRSSIPAIFQLDNRYQQIQIFGGSENNNSMYIGAFVKPTVQPAPAIASGFLPAIAKSVDGGVTWSDWEVIDFRTINGITNYDRLFDYFKGDQFSSYEADITVDKNGYPHLLLTLTDTTMHSNTGKNAIVEIYKTSSGWNAKTVVASIPDSAYSYFGINQPSYGQMGPSPHFSVNREHDAYIAQWTAPGELNAYNNDIYYALRSSSGNWSYGFNITNSPDINEIGAHITRNFYLNGNIYKSGVIFWYQAGTLSGTYNPDAIANIYFKTITNPWGVTSQNDVPVSFSLEQNFPNPFNPSTDIRFSLPSSGTVLLKIYNQVGQLVKTVLAGELAKGEHTVTFNADNLASGVYLYELTAGGSRITKKMVLQK